MLVQKSNPTLSKVRWYCQNGWPGKNDIELGVPSPCVIIFYFSIVESWCRHSIAERDT